jgi:hypothetical protein
MSASGRSYRWFPLLALVLVLSACGGGEEPTPDLVTLEGPAPSGPELARCLRSNGFELTMDTADPVYGTAEIELTIEVPGFAVAGGGTLHVFATVEEATEQFVHIQDVAFAEIERHRNTVLDELGSGALSEERAGPVRAAAEACIGPKAA